jgi:hypothetical protein
VIARHFFQQTGEPHLGAGGVSLQSLIKATRQYAQATLGHAHYIEIKAGSWPKNRFWSALVRTNDRSLILFHHSLNYCYRRLAMAIELSNIIMSDDLSLNTTDLVANLSGLRSGIVASPPLIGESTAFSLAIELLTPMQHRKSMEKRLAAQATSMEIAKRFHIPQFVSEWSINGGWALRSAIHEDLDAADLAAAGQPTT